MRRTEPCVGKVRAANMSRRVDLPAPLGPTIASSCDGQAVKETSRRMYVGGDGVQGVKRKLVALLSVAFV